MTVEELYDAIRSYTNRPNLSDAEVKLWVDAATGALSVALREHPRNLKMGKHTQPAGSTILRLPYDIVGLVDVRANSVYWRQYPNGMIDTLKQKTCSFVQIGDCLELSQAPAEATDFYVMYHRTLPPLFISGKPNWVCDLFPDVYLYRALQEAAIALKDTANGAVWTSEATARIANLMAQGWNQNIAAGPRTVF